MTSDALAVWGKFCRRFSVVEQCVPLFAVDGHGVVAHRLTGGSKRPVLSRSPQMEALVLAP
jgi:hypothetical protein